MPAVVDVAGAGCGHRFRIEYRRLGASVPCPTCGRTSVPAVPSGGTYPLSGWEITFTDFRQLVEDVHNRSAVEPLLAKWFGYRISGHDAKATILDARGSPIEPLALHLRIQDDDAMQQSLYRTAMTLWR